MPDSRKPLDAVAIALMVLLCASWGLQQVAIKVAASGVSPVMQAGIRSIIAVVLVLVWARMRGISLAGRDGTMWNGLLCGALFGAEFIFIYRGLEFTTASRMVVFIYLAPCFTALGVHFFVKGERLRLVQWIGVVLAFCGVLSAFADGVFSGGGSTMVGDLFGVIAAFGWALTTVIIRATNLARASATKTLFYQLGVSALMLPVASVMLGEPGVVKLTPLVVAILAYQGVLVAFASYLVWFWLLKRYLAGRLSVFSFMTPLFGVAFGTVLLSEPVTPVFLAAAGLVGGGIVLVNLPGRG
jgi:drug/metabolite transporter (DMT)-like permease